MSKMRVRELSAELGISNKELIQILRGLDIHVKSHMSGLTDEEVQLVREKITKTPQETVVERKAESGVIVRRRRKPKPKPEQKVELLKEEDKALPEPELKKEVTEKPVPETAPEVTSAKEVPQKIEPPQKEIKKAAPEKPEKEEKSKEELDQKKKELKPRKKARKKFKKKKKVIEPQVRVISKPEPPVAEPSTEPEVESELLPKAEVKEVVQVPVEEQKEEGKKKRKKKKKGKKQKRVVDFSDFYHDEEEEDKKAKKKKKAVKPEDKGPGKPKARAKVEKEAPEEPAKPTTQPIKASKRKVKIDEAIRVADMAKQMGIKAQDIIKTLLSLGVMATINQSIDIETATIVAAEFGYEVEKVGFSEDEFLLPKEEDKPEDLRPRPPVVTIMGHVDHGKTSLLDAIRKSKVTAEEAGGITQHIGAYYVSSPKGDIVFLDTPGHEAFTAMRARGAEVTDIVVLVVAADDGVMEQTREAINHSKAANVPIVVAVNKIDKEGANPDRVKRELAELGLVPEDWGGETIFTNVSAKKKIGIDELLEMILLQAEVLELKANPNKPAHGHIIEARLDKGRGPVGTVLIQGGTLRQGDAFVCGLKHGKVRAMFNDQGKKVKEAGPSFPVEVQGFDGVPEAGDEFVVVKDEKVARRIAEARQVKQRERELAKENKITLESLLAAKMEGETQTLNLVLKADVQGSLEAISEALRKLSTDEIKINIIHGGTGAISESDIMLASASSAIIIGFNVRPTAKVKEVAEKENVEIRFYNIIYDLVNDIKDAMAGMLAPIIKEQYLGQAEVLQTFSVPKVGTVAGCMVVDGKLMRNAKVRLLRNGVVIYTGKLSSLKRFKDDVKEVQKGFECGVGLENYNDIKVGDVIEAFEEVEEKAKL
ncbi:translation initiation factor IF-2 [Desulfohalobiaceae bacterium Ax17]|jgi:translation initiation factor IF-2|uniref:translation initiation factor IF-2 n=1 Tax=Desulfovulcanus ferrireducens TaxID=2831190 RepID=UPI00207B9E8A|nr:translation initiation factor IF-2 [Desulfovulcanus ferrireducens]MBT8763779.1 translation initiation factor IF-2 [Desulfovulcanus ferrireducens]